MKDAYLTGGSWYNLANNCRACLRYRIQPIEQNVNVGFRVIKVK